MPNRSGYLILDHVVTTEQGFLEKKLEGQFRS